MTAGLSQVDGVKYLDHKQCNVVFSKDSDAYGQTNIGACCLVVGNSNFEAQIDCNILADGSEKDNAEATSDGKRGSNGKTNAISHLTITLGPMQKRVDTKNEDICYSNPHAILCSSANY